MKTTLNLRAIASTMAVALAALLLLAPQAPAAKAPPLASTPQYEALVEYVDKLRGLRDKAATSGQKASYEQQLTNKHRAAVNRANALFQRVQAAEKAETRSRFQAAARKIRQAETAELADLRGAYADRLADARGAFQHDVATLAKRFDARYATLRRQINELRKEKAKAKGLAKKARIQEQINALIQEVGNSRTQEREAVTKLKQRYARQKKAIQAAKVAATTKVREARQEDVESLRSQWNRTLERRLADDRRRRANQVANLQSKLEAGRAYIASMPVSA